MAGSSRTRWLATAAGALGFAAVLGRTRRSRTDDLAAEAGAAADGHAPGHRHLPPPPDTPTGALSHRADRRWAAARRRSSGRTP